MSRTLSLSGNRGELQRTGEVGGRKLTVVVLGQHNFPYGFAAAQNIRLLSKGLIRAGCTVTIINKLWGGGASPEGFTPELRGIFEGIEYIYATGSCRRPASFWVRNFKKGLRWFFEILAVHRVNQRFMISAAIVSTNNFFSILLYRLLSKIYGFTLIQSVVEFLPAITREAPFLRRVNAHLADRAVLTLADGFLPISDFLVNRIRRYAPGKPWLKDPCLVDLARFDGIVRDPTEEYFLFCGSLGYLEIVSFILQAFDLVKSSYHVYLYLVVNGYPEHLEVLRQQISIMKRGHEVRVLSALSDRELSSLYVNALALLIPIRPIVQDLARFPHKIGEYCASGRPMITTCYGDVKERFKHLENAIFASEYSVKEYARAMELALEDPRRTSEIGARGRQLAEEQFEYQAFGRKLRSFIEALTPQ